MHGEDVQRLESHRVVAAEHVLVAQQIAADPVRLDERGSAAHERVRDPESPEFVRAKEDLVEGSLPELGEPQAAKQCARTSREPLVDADDRPVVLLDLLLPERHVGDQGDIEAPFDTHVRFPSSGQVPRHSLQPGRAASTVRARRSKKTVVEGGELRPGRLRARAAPRCRRGRARRAPQRGTLRSSRCGSTKYRARSGTRERAPRARIR